MNIMPLGEVRKWCARHGVTDDKRVMRAYKRQEQGMDQSKWLLPPMKEGPPKINGMSLQEVAVWASGMINAKVIPQHVRINRRDQLAKNPNRSDVDILCHMLAAFWARKFKS